MPETRSPEELLEKAINKEKKLTRWTIGIAIITGTLLLATALTFMLFPPAAALIAPFIVINSISSGIGVCAFFALIGITAFLPTIGLSRAQRSASDELSELRDQMSTPSTHPNNEEPTRSYSPSASTEISNGSTANSNPATRKLSLFEHNDSRNKTSRDTGSSQPTIRASL